MMARSALRVKPFRSLDVFRGIAALWVVMGHGCVPFVAAHQAYATMPLYAWSAQGQLGVVLFFVISGYCIMAAVYGALLRQKSVGRYCAERVRRIYPPYLIALLLTLGFSLVMKLAVQRHWMPQGHLSFPIETTIRYWIGNLFFLQYVLHVPFTNIVFWSLCYEMAFYLVLGILFFIAKIVAREASLRYAKLSLIIGTSFLAVCSLSWLLIYNREGFPADLWHLFALGSLLFFCLENSSNSDESTVPQAVPWFAFGTVAALTAALGWFRQIGHASYDHPSTGVKSAVAILFCLALVLIHKRDDWFSESRWLRPFVWVGSFSYSLYLIHPLVLPVVDVMGRKMGLDGRWYVATFLAEIVGAVVAGRVMFAVVERFFLSKRQLAQVSVAQKY